MFITEGNYNWKNELAAATQGFYNSKASKNFPALAAISFLHCQVIPAKADMLLNDTYAFLCSHEKAKNSFSKNK